MQGPKHGSLEAAAAARKQRPMQQRDSVSSRYTTEPRKPNMNREEGMFIYSSHASNEIFHVNHDIFPR